MAANFTLGPEKGIWLRSITADGEFIGRQSPRTTNDATQDEGAISGVTDASIKDSVGNPVASQEAFEDEGAARDSAEYCVGRHRDKRQKISRHSSLKTMSSVAGSDLPTEDSQMTIEVRRACETCGYNRYVAIEV